MNRDYIREVYKQTKSYRKTAKICNTSHTSVYRVINNKTTVNKYKKCLDEIEGICKLSLHCDSCYEILQKIKQAKEGGE